MQTLNPAETFPIVRIISNHLDTNTYYVRAVVKDATNEAVLATIDLADKGGLYYRTNWKVVWDNTMSRGRFLTITTSIYTDSGYTTKSNSYGDEIATYLVQERWDPLKHGGGFGSSSGITSSDVRKIIKEELGNIKKPKDLDTKNLITDITKSVIGSLPDVKDYPVVDLTGMETGIRKAIQDIDSVSKDVKARPKFEKTNISELVSEVTKLITAEFTKVHKSINQAVNEKNLSLNIDVNGQGGAAVKEDVESKKIKRLRTKYKI